MVAGTIEGMRVAFRRDPEFVLKLDTDSLMIRPVADELREVFTDGRVGFVGSYPHTYTGAPREWAEWEPKLRRATQPVAWVRGTRCASARLGTHARSNASSR